MPDTRRIPSLVNTPTNGTPTNGAPTHGTFRRRIAAALLLALGAVVLPGAAGAADTAVTPTFGVRVYEVFLRGPKAELEERTSRAFAPNHVRNIALGETWPPEDRPAIRVYKSRDHIDWVGSYWREDGSNDYGKYRVEVTEAGATDEPGTALVRVKVVERTDSAAQAMRKMRHPERPSLMPPTPAAGGSR